jgi:hypothetical protein
MEAHVTGTKRSPAQVYALGFGALLTIIGIAGFFYNSEFTTREEVHDAVFGILNVNGWENVVHVLTGVLGLVVASSYSSARSYAFGFGLIYFIIAIWGFIIGSGHSILSLIPVNTEDSVFHLFVGLSGIAAGVATPAVADPTTRPVST